MRRGRAQTRRAPSVWQLDSAAEPRPARDPPPTLPRREEVANGADRPATGTCITVLTAGRTQL